MYAIVLYTRVSYVLYVVAGCGRSYVRSVARVVWRCLRVGHVGDSARMAPDWLKMRQNQLKARQSRQTHEAG